MKFTEHLHQIHSEEGKQILSKLQENSDVKKDEDKAKGFINTFGKDKKKKPSKEEQAFINAFVSNPHKAKTVSKEELAFLKSFVDKE